MAKKKSLPISSHNRRKPKRPARSPETLKKSPAKKTVHVRAYKRRKA